ncbi:MAG: hypothetical protein BGO12_01640 [Verrucomicrobia bacterium 61-8]|nr:NTP transferase domain-containing protein [Verrucomicrobiota bacterium]OJV02250.1 MAG: hypothetical protein BGO12_01640 [Verrucomicrobia bacterium 61-8]
MIIRHLYISPGHNYRGHHGGPAGENPILSVPRVECVAGRGIVGDRYFDYKPDFKGQITFFESENLVRMWEELAIPLDRRDPAATRRNVIVEGLNLSALIGQEFEIQGVRFLGTEECKPCYWMNGAIHSEAEEWMKGRGGLRAKILSDGMMEVNCQYAAVLLTGGQSSRMGQDKAQMLIRGQPLWSRQMQMLRSIGNTVAVSAGRQPDWLPDNAEWVADVEGVKGPLAGLLASIAWAKKKSATHLIAVAVDLPHMQVEVLCQILDRCAAGLGVVAKTNHGYEPLAAIYPIEAESIVRVAAEARRWKLQDLVAELTEKGLLTEFTPDDEAAFHNMNSPTDVPR